MRVTANFDAVHQDLTALPQFCIRAGKQPYVHDGDRKNSFTSSGWPEHRKDWLTFSEAVDAVRRGVKVYHDGTYQPADGIGFLVTRSNQEAQRPMGGDLDCCRNPMTGLISPWATAFLQSVQPFYTEISPSKCGLRFFVWGHLPNEMDNVFGSGPQDDLSEDDKETILTAKPKAREKLVKGNPAFNGLEIYEANRHLTVTGLKLAEYCFSSEDRTDALSNALKPFLGAEAVGKVAEEVKQAGRGKLPHLNILDVIDTKGFTESGGQLFGSHPTEGSSTGQNLVIDPRSDVWAYMHNKPSKGAPGGDAWVWLACECGALAWGRAGAGALKDGQVMRKTLEHAVRRGLVPEDILGSSFGDMESAKILERIKADPRALKEPAILAALAALKTNDSIEYDLLSESIKKVGTGIKVATINDLVDKCIQEGEKAAEKPTETPGGIKEKARAIAERGDPLKYLIWQAQRNHIGDVDYQKVLIASIISAASETSNGIQPGGNGDKGSGKSDACTATYHIVPMERRLDGSLSPMSLFYLQETGRLKPGMILYSDDVEYEPIIPMYKRSTARFQQGITHFTVTSGKNRESIELRVPPRMVWWLTSVESVANEQAFDRQYPISTDSSSEHKKRVAKEIAARRTRKELKLAEDDGIKVARAIISDIFDNGPFKVLIPQAGKAGWLKVSDFRGQEQFWDLVDALTILRWRQRRRDEDGWLIADDQDLIEAKEIHSGHKVAHFADLTEAEAKLVGVMTDGLSKTQKQLTEALGVAQSTLSERLRSIMAKSAIITEDYDQGKKIYTLNPKMQLGTDFWNSLDLIDLKINISETYRSQRIALSGCYRYVIGLPIGIIINNSNRIPSSLSVDKDGSIEKGYPCDDCGRCPLKEYLSSIHSPAKKTDNDPNPKQEPLSDTDKPADDRTDKTDNDNSEPIDVPIRQSSDPVEDIGAVIDTKTPDSFVCAVCGADLTGHGHIQKGDNFFCAKVGCGYPAREKKGAEA